MTRHVIDHREAPDSRKRVARILKKDKQELGQTRRRKLIEHPHETGNGRPRSIYENRTRARGLSADQFFVVFGDIAAQCTDLEVVVGDLPDGCNLGCGAC